MISPCTVAGFSSSIPEKRVTNEDLEAFVDTSAEWIVSRTGISARHVLQANENLTDLAIKASTEALKKSGVNANEVTHVILATCTPEYLCPSSACIVAHGLGMGEVMAFDISAACSGFVYALDVAKSFLAASPKAVVLLICAEALSRRLNWNDRSTCVLFGDGAGACVLKNGAMPGGAVLEDVLATSDGAQALHIAVGGGTKNVYKQGDPIGDEFFLTMQGREVFKHAVRNMTKVSEAILKKNNLTLDHVDLFIPHQANLRIIEAVGERLSIDPAKTFLNLQSYGNTSAASIPLAITEALQTGKIQQGMRVLMATFGSGFTWGAGLLRF